MNNTLSEDLSSSVETKSPIKRLWNIGPHLVCIIDKNIVKKLEINENIIVEQQLTNDGILLKIKKL